MKFLFRRFCAPKESFPQTGSTVSVIEARALKVKVLGNFFRLGGFSVTGGSLNQVPFRVPLYNVQEVNYRFYGARKIRNNIFAGQVALAGTSADKSCHWSAQINRQC